MHRRGQPASAFAYNSAEQSRTGVDLVNSPVRSRPFFITLSTSAAAAVAPTQITEAFDTIGGVDLAFELQRTF
jgi:hypothetical protein